ncbi:MAG: hypothetical protein AB8B87_10375 [Granulosicoccus sp.]
MTPQSDFMIVVPILPEKREALQALLDSMNVSPGLVNPANTTIPFEQFDTLHSARLLIIDANTAHEIEAFGWQPHNWPAALAFLGDVDGETKDFLANLSIRASNGLQRLYQHCDGFETHTGTLLEWLELNSAKPAATYVNWFGRTVLQVRQDECLQKSLSLMLPGLLKKYSWDNPRQIRQELLNHVERERHSGNLTLTPETPTSWRYRCRYLIDLISLPLLLFLLSPLLVLITPMVALRLRYAEKTDPDIHEKPSTVHIRKLSEIEDLDVCNQFNVFGDVKPGMFRYLLLKFIMKLVNYAARHVYKRGYLARVRTIHFARWVFLNNNRSMFFASQYDGSLESYMDDFINKVAFGLNLTFSHGVGYPRTRWIIKGGAELEQPFKDTLRRHQLPSAVWYHAHPGLTALDMSRNARIRRGIESYPADDNSIRLWLSEIRT